MPCYYPITAYRSKAGRNQSTGKWPLVFREEEGIGGLPVVISCGKCIGCRLERSRQWAIRCMHEASLHDKNCFLTLTYDEEHLPRACNVVTGEIGDGLPVLRPRDVTLFIKRLRKRFGSGIRYFMCGEYGEKRRRPHYHMIIFGFDFPRKILLGKNHGFNLFWSPVLNSPKDFPDPDPDPLWPHGQCMIGSATWESAAYVARYITKKRLGDDSQEYYDSLDLVPEYVRMSRRPGIAAGWFEKFFTDVYPADRVVVRHGFVARPPRYYDRLFDLQSPKVFAKIKKGRVEAALKNKDTPQRLRDKEQSQKLRFAKLVRPLESNL